MAKKTLAEIKKLIGRVVELQDRNELCDEGQEIYDEFCEIVGKKREVTVSLSFEEDILMEIGPEELTEGDYLDGEVEFKGKKYPISCYVSNIEDT